MTWSIFDDWWDLDPWLSRGWWRRGRERVQPAVNIYGKDDRLVLTSEIAGLKSEDLTLEINGRILTLKGSRQREEPGEDACYTCQERSAGEFERTITLPYEVDQEKVEARYENGVLLVKLPRAERDKPRKIEVKAA